MATQASMTAATRVEFGSPWERWVERHLRVLMIAPAMTILLALTIFPSIYMFVAAVTAPVTGEASQAPSPSRLGRKPGVSDAESGSAEVDGG